MHDFRLKDAVVRPRLNEIHISGRQEKLPAKFIDVLMERSGTTNYRFDDLMLEYVTHDGFRYRREGGAP